MDTFAFPCFGAVWEYAGCLILSPDFDWSSLRVILATAGPPVCCPWPMVSRGHGGVSTFSRSYSFIEQAAVAGEWKNPALDARISLIAFRGLQKGETGLGR